MIVSFWCNNCKKDLDLPAYIKKDWVIGIGCENYIKSDKEWFVAQCPKCRKELVRNKNHNEQDPYFRLSEKVRRDVVKYARDLIQPSHPDFDEIYPQHKKEREDKLIEEDKKLWEQALQGENSIASARGKYNKLKKQ